MLFIDDAMSVHMMVAELLREDSSPVQLYKPQDIKVSLYVHGVALSLSKQGSMSWKLHQPNTSADCPALRNGDT